MKLERDAFVWMDFNDRATGDAAILVVTTQILLTLGRGTSLISLIHPFTLVQVLLGGLFFWVVYSGALYVVSRHLFDATGHYAIYLRITGFAYPTLLLVVFTAILLNSPLFALLLGGAWFVLIVANGLTYTVDLGMQKAVAAAIGGYILVVIVQAIFGSIWLF
ncbi:MAG: YIP1 family protein [Actinomycetota bacterium]|nr:YIP1 family protein [Actinomycetota bacterium]